MRFFVAKVCDEKSFRTFMKHWIYIMCLTFAFSSCIEEYSISKNISNGQKQIVIQGHIRAGDQSVFYISYAKSFGDMTSSQETILNAKINIIGKNGYESEKAKFDIEQDRYCIDTHSLEPNTLYAVKVEAEGEIYQSEFLSLLDTPEIEEINYTEQKDRITFYVSTINDNDASRYYMWSFEEDWEFTASVDFASFPKNYYYIQDTYPMNCPETQTYYRCWNHNESSNVYLASTEHLDENSIKNQFLFSIPADDARISCVYSLLLKQFTLSKEAYTYYSHIKKLTEENNGIFQPMPYEVYGNVNCISRPEKKVLGYILASNISTKRIFVNAADFKKCIPIYTGVCAETELPATTDIYKKRQNVIFELKGGAVLFYPSGHNYDLNDPWDIEFKGNELLYSRQCVDCRMVNGATNKRPNFWPNFQ